MPVRDPCAKSMAPGGLSGHVNLEPVARQVGKGVDHLCGDGYRPAIDAIPAGENGSAVVAWRNEAHHDAA